MSVADGVWAHVITAYGAAETRRKAQDGGAEVLLTSRSIFGCFATKSKP